MVGKAPAVADDVGTGPELGVRVLLADMMDDKGSGNPAVSSNIQNTWRSTADTKLSINKG